MRHDNARRNALKAKPSNYDERILKVVIILKKRERQKWSCRDISAGALICERCSCEITKNRWLYRNRRHASK